MKRPTTRSRFTRLAKVTSRAVGQPGAFLTAAGLVLAWAITGPYFHYSEVWQLVINTATTITTFLMVFLIQNTQNRDAEAMHLKLDELIRAMHGAHNALLDLEELEDKDLDHIRRDYLALAKHARDEIRKGKPDTGRVELKRP